MWKVLAIAQTLVNTELTLERSPKNVMYVEKPSLNTPSLLDISNIGVKPYKSKECGRFQWAQRPYSASKNPHRQKIL